MHDFDFQAPRSLERALSLLAGAGGQGRALAGGTDLIVQMKAGVQSPSLLVDVKGIPELGVLEFHGGEGLRIGAAVPLAKVAHFAPVRERFNLLGQACSAIGSLQVRNRGTVGGNLCNAA
ncbi:MAG: FAD binding domain-containing protein, partial [Chloroflexota bacterium]|nr:FAD binding domain-containing protein [Chloroflexota bacterium]